jgi:hypothetical protein
VTNFPPIPQHIVPELDVDCTPEEYLEYMQSFRKHDEALEQWLTENLPGNRGLAWRCGDGKTYALLSRDPFDRDCWRRTLFDEEGWPIRHTCYFTKLEAFKETVDRDGALAVDIPCPPRQDGTTEELLSRYGEMVRARRDDLKTEIGRLFKELLLFRYLSHSDIFAAI